MNTTLLYALLPGAAFFAVLLFAHWMAQIHRREQADPQFAALIWAKRKGKRKRKNDKKPKREI